MVFRVAGGPDIGFGHLRRSWTLAEQLSREGCKVYFVTATVEDATLLSKAGFSVWSEEKPHHLARTIQLLQTAPSPKLCLVDDPRLSGTSLAALRKHALVACVDDTGEREMPVDLVVNGSAGAEILRYRGLKETLYMLGPQYILLRKEFMCEPVERRLSQDIQRVLILTGGGQPGAWLQVVLAVVAETLPRAVIDVIVGPFSQTSTFEGSLHGQVVWHRSPPDIRALMLSADLAVSAGGQTLYELAATATPTLGIRVAANQALNLRGLARAGCLRDLGVPVEPGFRARLAEGLAGLAADARAREDMGRRGRNVVDGRGAERVAARLERLLDGSQCHTRAQAMHDGGGVT